MTTANAHDAKYLQAAITAFYGRHGIEDMHEALACADCVNWRLFAEQASRIASAVIPYPTDATKAAVLSALAGEL